MMMERTAEICGKVSSREMSSGGEVRNIWMLGNANRQRFNTDGSVGRFSGVGIDTPRPPTFLKAKLTQVEHNSASLVASST